MYSDFGTCTAGISGYLEKETRCSCGLHKIKTFTFLKVLRRKHVNTVCLQVGNMKFAIT